MLAMTFAGSSREAGLIKNAGCQLWYLTLKFLWRRDNVGAGILLAYLRLVPGPRARQSRPQ
jgi:hypothetical protein